MGVQGGEKGSHGERSLSVYGVYQLVAQATSGELEKDVFQCRRMRLQPFDLCIALPGEPQQGHQRRFQLIGVDERIVFA